MAGEGQAVPTTAAAMTLPDQIEVLTLDTARWLRDDSTEALMAAAVAVAIYFALVGLRWGIVRVLGGSGDVTTWKGFAGRIIRRTRSFFLASVSAYSVIHVVVPPGPLVAVIDFVFVFSGAIQGAIWLREIILAMVERRAEASEDSADFASAIGIIRVLVNIAVWALATILVLDNLGVNVTALVAGLGVGGIAIGLAAQGIFSDLFAALSMLFDRPFRVGDTIQFGTNTGTVEAIGLKTVRVRLLSGEQLVIGNTQLLAQEVSNLKRIEARRVVLVLGVTYQTPPEMLDALPGHIEALVSGIENARFDRAVFTSFGASSIDFVVRFWIRDPQAGLTNVRGDVLLALWDAFKANGIAIPFPHREILMRTPVVVQTEPREDAPVPARQDDNLR